MIGAAAGLVASLLTTSGSFAQAEAVDRPVLTGLKAEASAAVEGRAKQVQVMNDMLFSFSELAFQEFETQKYLTELLEKEGFKIETGVSGMPSGWWATWGEGKPVIALGSDVDGIPKASQMPGVAYRKPMVEGAPGHGEGHNSGQSVIIAAALAAKEIMERDGIPGTLMIWPGIAEELVGAKAYYARDGRFKNVDAVIFTHVGKNMSVSWGGGRGTGLVSVEYAFEGVAAHGAGDPWRGRSALDAVELMNVAWNYRREHLRPLQRSHYVIVNGGDQPNVVPSEASVWYFIREITADRIRENYAALDRIAEGAAMMTDTTFSKRVVGSAWPRHFNKPIAEAMYENIKAVGLPTWSDDDQRFAKAVQALVEAEEQDGLALELEELLGPPEDPESGGSDDIGDVSWSVPTVTLRYPSNIEGVQGHHWSSAISMATPIAHKGAVAGAKVTAATIIDLLTDPELIESAWDYFKNEQLKETTYQPFVDKDDQPTIERNADIMNQYKEQLSEFYYRPDEFDTYLEQLGVDYPETKPSSKKR
ncbi:MAG: amidohydrolase [Alphaproteobacteria bacterium]|nr:amidohydrolase [Alphaproteobacteria bacterium]